MKIPIVLTAYLSERLSEHLIALVLKVSTQKHFSSEFIPKYLSTLLSSKIFKIKEWGEGKYLWYVTLYPKILKS